jgi:hypothetical protein
MRWLAGDRESVNKWSMFPQRLEPSFNQGAYGGTEVPPLQSGERARES